jgi:hypothetical protein
MLTQRRGLLMRAWLFTGVEEMEPSEFLSSLMCLCIGCKTADDTSWMQMAKEAFDSYFESQRIPIMTAACALLAGSRG